MKPRPPTHPSPDALSAFRQGALEETESAAIAGHVASCEACRRACQQLPASSATVPADTGVAGPPPELADHPKFRIVRRLGQGGMGAVYLAEHRLMERPVAIKVLNRALLDHPDALPRFLGEIKAAARLDHENIVRAHDAERAGDLHMLVMEYVEGQSLDRVLRRKGPLPVPHACHCARQAALGLQYASDRGMVHRDIKPQNLMLTPQGKVKILDFGLARVRSEGSGPGGLTQDGSFMGTPEYVAPEQATDARQADIRADIYSLGATLFCLLTGRPPFQEETGVLQVLARLEKEPPRVRELRPDVPAELSAVVARMLAKDPARRYQTPAEVAQALAPFCKPGTMAGEPQPAPQRVSQAATTELAPRTGSRPAPRTAGRTRRPAVLAAAAVGAALVLAAAGAIGLALRTGPVAAVTGRAPGQPRPAVAAAPAAAEPGIPPTAPPSSARPADGAAVPVDDGWEPLFNGRNFEGWGRMIPINAKDPKKQTWITDPARHVLASLGGDFNELMTERTFKNFTLRLEWRFTPGGFAGVNGSGVVVRSTGLNANGLDPRGIEIDLRNNKDEEKGIGTGCFLVYGAVLRNHRGVADGDKSRHLGWLREPPAVPEGAWNSCEIRCHGDRITVFMNGALVNDGWGAEAVAGRVVLRNQNTAAEFRNIRIKEDREGPDAAEAAPGGGWSTLFNGKDLAGWTPAAGDDVAWQAKDNDLVGVGVGGSRWLFTDKDYDNFVLRFEYRLRQSDRTNSGVALRALPTDRRFRTVKFIDDLDRNSNSNKADEWTGSVWVQGPLPAPPKQHARLRPGGEWNGVELVLDGERLTVTVNGDRVQEIALRDLDLPHPAGRIGLEARNSIVRFRNLRLRPLGRTGGPG